MDDLTICKKIAEIEGVPHVIDTDCLGNHRMLLTNEYCNKNKCSFVYNPLTDDGLCFRLMIKYKVRTHWLWWESDGTPHYEAYINEDSSDINYDGSPNKAILLAIIEANNEN